MSSRPLVLFVSPSDPTPVAVPATIPQPSPSSAAHHPSPRSSSSPKTKKKNKNKKKNKAKLSSSPVVDKAATEGEEANEDKANDRQEEQPGQERPLQNPLEALQDLRSLSSKLLSTSAFVPDSPSGPPAEPRTADTPGACETEERKEHGTEAAGSAQDSRQDAQSSAGAEHIDTLDAEVRRVEDTGALDTLGLQDPKLRMFWESQARNMTNNIANQTSPSALPMLPPGFPGSDSAAAAAAVTGGPGGTGPGGFDPFLALMGGAVSTADMKKATASLLDDSAPFFGAYKDQKITDPAYTPYLSP